MDLYTPIGAESLGPRPGFVATHSGVCALRRTNTPAELTHFFQGYAVNNETGDRGEMDTACRHFASRGFVAITMVYRLTNEQTGGGLTPANWTVNSPLPKSWQGGFKPAPRAIWAAVRDTKAALRWLRGNAAMVNLDKKFVGAGGWSAGACTTVYLASQRDDDFTSQMSRATDPTFHTLEPYLSESTDVLAGVVWAGNGVVSNTIDALDGIDRYSTTSASLAMYRGTEGMSLCLPVVPTSERSRCQSDADNVMTPWAQTNVQRLFNASTAHARCDLFTAPGVGHSTLFPEGNVTMKNGVSTGTSVPVMNHSFTWITAAMSLTVK